MRPLRIVDVTNSYSDTGGGVRTYVRQKFAYFEGRGGWSYALIAPGRDNRTLDLPGGRLHYVRGFGARVEDGPGGYRMMWDGGRVREVLARERPDLVEIGAPYWDFALARLASLYSDPVYAGFYHTEFRDAYVGRWTAAWPGWAQRAALRLCNTYLRTLYRDLVSATFVASRCVQQELEAIGIRDTRLVPLGVDLNRFDPIRRDEDLRRAWNAGPGDRVLLHCGRLSREKGTHVVLEAASGLLEDPSVHLVFAGRGGLEEEIESLAASRDRVHFMGYVQDPALVGTIFASSDVYLGTGPYETFGLCILEALASGLPVVTADEGAGPELAERSRAGIHFRSGDPDSLCARTCDLLSMNLGYLSVLARRWAVTNGSWKATFDRLVAHYEELLAERGAVPAPAVLETVAPLPERAVAQR